MDSIFSLSEKINFLPVVHGSGNFSREVRQRILSSGCDCLAVCLPPEFQSTVEQGIHKLPYISISGMEEAQGTLNYVPIDPVQPVIMALRIALQEGISRKFIDLSVPEYELRDFYFPDSFALRGLSLEKFAAALLPAIQRPASGSQHDQRARWMAYQLHQLELDYSRITLVCSMLDWPWIKEAYRERLPYPQPKPAPGLPALYGVEHDTLFFALAEFPYITYLYELNRQNLKSDRDVAIDGVKEIMLRARDIFLDKHKIRYHNLTAQTLQVFLKYVRNLTLLENRLTPDLYTLATSAKQIGGDAYAIALMEAARDYPFQEAESEMDKLELGINKAALDEDHVLNMKNRLSETELEWRTLDLKPDPEKFKQEQWKYTWNPYGQCSWPPEDEKIESLNTHVREQTKVLLSNDLARTEKFTSSVKDGIDIRDTLRNWHTGDIYVKEIPPSRGTIEVVVFLFEMEPHPERYPWRQTWYAEHKSESTLCFFATNYGDNLIGPGIGQATYGGCMMIYPPRPIINIWEDPRMFMGETLEEKLLEAAFFHSREKHITLVSPGPPQPGWRRMARQYQKRIIHIPLKRFS
ncbi:MAG: hypothetical protein GWM98_03170, partial [Nitrospinaceae bacterium]|nr:hypothetical protein [Nitrospinaceae bacterium]NIR53692.1 hypothetical protein [Nitrospinaceae bacterium]NIS84103.1 hypothetical protein [Nitrospinaceae bacterium]NIT80903.1 hypothetical protein [Nitrospinaceae bacterium]NIU43201.1 hypothetical protein [Nitrospinaceae bacterium]